jgi:hypothetical protein
MTAAQRLYIQSPNGSVRHIASGASLLTPGHFWAVCGQVKAPHLGKLDEGHLPTCKSCERVQASRDRRQQRREAIAAFRAGTES